MSEKTIVGICGGSAAGKSLLARFLQKEIQSSSFILSQDRYYKNIGPLTPEERLKENFDHPEAIDHDRLVQDLKRFQRGEAIEIPKYDFVSCSWTGFEKINDLPPVLILEGLFILCVPEILALLDFSIFIDSNEEKRVQRIIRRDLKTRGRTEETVRENLSKWVLPMHNQFIQSYNDKANLVVKNNSDEKETLSELAKQAAFTLKHQFPSLGAR